MKGGKKGAAPFPSTFRTHAAAAQASQGAAPSKTLLWPWLVVIAVLAGEWGGIIAPPKARSLPPMLATPGAPSIAR